MARILAALAICAPLLAPLGAPGLINPDEEAAAEIGREMAATGDWLVPRLHGIPHWAKPPLAYWAIGACMSVLGPTERAARLPSAVAASLTLLATWVLARRIGGSRLALLAVLALASMIEFHVLGRMATPDMIQTACTSWAAALLWIARSPRGIPRRRAVEPARLAAFACLGVAFVDKGPVALGVTACALLAFVLLRPKASLLSSPATALGLVVALAIGLPWFLAVVGLHPGLRTFFLEGELRDRVLTPHGRGQAFWFFPAVLAAGTAPSDSALAVAVGRIVARLRRPRADDVADDADRFVLAWIAGPFLLFSVAGSKLAHYLLPILPFCAIAAARWMGALGPGRRGRGWIVAVAVFPAVLAWGAGLAAVLGYGARPAGWIGAAAIVTALSVFWILGVGRKRAPLAPAVAAGRVAVVTWAWVCAVAFVAREDDMSFTSHASQSWLRDALAGETVRGVPIGSAAAAPTGDRLGDATFARLRVRSHSVELYVLGMRAEYLPNFGHPEEWEMAADQERATRWTLEDLVARLRLPARMVVLARADALPQVEAALGRPLRRIRSHGRGAPEVVLVTNE